MFDDSVGVDSIGVDIVGLKWRKKLGRTHETGHTRLLVTNMPGWRFQGSPNWSVGFESVDISETISYGRGTVV